MIQRIKAISTRIANFEASIVLTLVYIFLVPILFLLRKRQTKVGWVPWSYHAETLTDAQQ